MDEMTEEELFEKNINAPQVLEAWNIPRTRRLAQVTFVIFIVCIVATALGACLYLVLGDFAQTKSAISGFVFVVALATCTVVVRVFQRRDEYADTQRLADELRRSFSGQDEHDLAIQKQLEEKFDWNARRWIIVVRMMGIAMFVLVAIDTYQQQTLNISRMLVFDGSLLIWLAGSLWNNYALKLQLLKAELEQRLKAAIHYRKTHVEPEDDIVEI